MSIISKLSLLLAISAVNLAPVFADEQQQSDKQNQSAQSTSSSSTSEAVGPDGTVTRKTTYSRSSSSSTSSAKSENSSPGSNASAGAIVGSTPGEEAGAIIESNQNGVIRKFVPKFRQRLVDLADQVKMAQGKGFITADEASKFMDRQAKLLVQEESANKKGFPRPELDELERAITLLNGDLFKAMRKADPVKPGASEAEVNDPNLIPAYNDPELQPGSGKVDK